MHQNSILIHLFFFQLQISPWWYVLCKTAIWADDSALSQQEEFLFFISYFLILKCHDLVLKAIYSGSNIKKCFKNLKFLTEHLWNFTKNVFQNQTFQNIFIATVPVLCIWKWCTQSQVQKIKLKGCFNTFLPVDSFFLTYK